MRSSRFGFAGSQEITEATVEIRVARIARRGEFEIGPAYSGTFSTSKPDRYASFWLLAHPGTV